MNKELNIHKMISKNRDKYRKFINKNPEVGSAITIFLVMLFSFFIIASCKSAVGSEKAVTSIADNSAEEYFYKKEYDKAIEEY